jgi:zinc protease
VVAFHNTYYRPDNATLIVAGDFDPKQLDVWVDRYFGRLTKPNMPIPRVGASEPPWAADRANATTAPKVPLPAVALVWLGPTAKSADAPALQVASALLSSGESSRLNQSLVYRQRIAGQASFEADLRDGPGLLTATAVAAGGKSLAAVKDALLAEVLRLAREPATAAELAKVKTQVVTGALLSRQTPEGLASAMADAAVMQGNANKINTGLVDLQNVTAADVTRVMQRYVANAHLVAITYTQAPGQAPE